MARRYSHTEKEKWVSTTEKKSKKAPISIPPINCTSLIEEYRFTLIGRVTNPSIQKTRALVDFFLQHWQVVGAFTGRALGPLLFQFTFESEQDLQAILSQAPYHFKRWMFILQRWEPIVSDLFPSTIYFWITIHGLPLHYWSNEALEAIGKGLGHVESTDSDNGRVRVQINGLQPLEKYLEISLPSGETKQVELEYEKLDKHCFSCLSLSHEVKDCPAKATRHASSDQSMGISQRRTLERLDDSKRRADSRKRSRFSPYEESRELRRTENRPKDDQTYQRKGDDELRNFRSSGRYENASNNSYSNRSVSASADRGRSRERFSARTRDSQDRLTPIRESSEVSLRSRGTRTINPVSQNIWRPVNGMQGNGSHANSLQSQVSHTPSPLPNREPITSPASNLQGGSRSSGGYPTSTPVRRPALERLADGEANSSRGERRSALERLSEGDANISVGERRSALEGISTPPTRVPLLSNGVANSDSGRLQEVNIQYLEEMFPYHTPEALAQPSKPSSSRAPPSGTNLDAGMLERSPIRTLSEDRAHVSLRLGPLPACDSAPSPPLTLKSAGKRKSARATVVRKTPRSPAQGISLNKRHITKAINSPKRKLLPDPKIKKKGKTKATGQPSAVLIPATKKKKADFRSAPPSLP
ncbi:hypothetical protein Bca4012_039871 [Brassica carinata]